MEFGHAHDETKADNSFQGAGSWVCGAQGIAGLTGSVF